MEPDDLGLEELFSEKTDPVQEKLLSAKLQDLLSAHKRTVSPIYTLQEIEHVQGMIEEEMRRESSTAYRRWARFRDYILRPEPRVAPEELFERQLGNLRSLSGWLHEFTMEATDYHQELSSYRRDITDSLRQDCLGYRDVQQSLAGILEGELETQDQRSEARGLASQQTLLGQRIIFQARESQLLEEYEELLSSSGHFCRLVGQNVAMVVRHLTHTRDLYDRFGDQLVTVQDLMSATELLGDYLGQLNATLSDNSLALSRQASEAYHTGAFPQLVSGGLQPGLDQLQRAEMSHHTDIERIVGQFLDSDEGPSERI